MIEYHTAQVAIAARNRIGEGPTWDALGQRLIWADLETGQVYAAQENGAGTWRQIRSWQAGSQVSAVLPRVRGGLVVAGGLDIRTLDEQGDAAPVVLARLDGDPARERINDAKCDPRGRLWAGTLTSDFTPGASALYRIDPDGAVTRMLERVTLGNGLDWSPDGTVFYFIDSLTLGVDAFDFDVERGTIANRRTVVTIERGAGAPNGLAVDREGGLWVALTGGGEVRRYLPDGTLRARVAIATPGATSCIFGGRDGRDLFITSLGRRMAEIALTIGVPPDRLDNDGPEAGSVFVCRPGLVGTQPTPFAG
jgi:sugar lactone lactonase YvrE